MAAFVAGSSVIPADVHFSWPRAQSKYVANNEPHFASPNACSQVLRSAAVGGGLFGQLPFVVHGPDAESSLEQPVTAFAAMVTATASGPNVATRRTLEWLTGPLCC